MSIAYRTNYSHKSTIHFAAEVIHSIRNMENAIVLIGDFENFFDKLDHKLLLKRLKEVLETSYLEKDWYNVFKSLTKFGYVEKSVLENHLKLTPCKNSYFSTIKDFREYQKCHKISYNANAYGIPQGNSMSGVLANIYSIDFDRSMGDLAKKHNGIYRRYSDDFIIVIPSRTLQHFDNEISNNIKQEVIRLAIDNKISLQESKTSLTLHQNNQVFSVDALGASHIDYLGFTFDGINVKMREKSIYKFYRNARKEIQKAHIIKKHKKLTKLSNRRKIYSLYTDFGSSNEYRSNFIDYAKRSQKIFDELSPSTNNKMLEQLKNRKKIIERALGYRIHSRINKK